jgi:HPt (histidine-containing phosphotransfer) domain-containing protein
MAQSEDLAQAAARLEAALERIANATARLRESGPAPTEVAARLDTLITQLRHALSANVTQ